MVNRILASLALLGTSALAIELGSAIVVNKCSYGVYLNEVPAAGGGYEQSWEYLTTGSEWSQVYTTLSNAQGWSIKLSTENGSSNIMQYEYTYHSVGFDSDIIWYDLSDVNGNPWNGDWEITSNSEPCQPKQAAYMYATDDAYGMQSCAANASITVTLCSGNDVAASSISTTVAGATSSSTSAALLPTISVPSVSVPTTSATPTTHSTSTSATPTTHSTSTSATPTTHSTSTAATQSEPNFWSFMHQANAATSSVEESATPSPTTFATSTTAVVTEEYGFTVTEIDTAIVTEIVTATAPAGERRKRHEHHRAHRMFA